MQTKQSTLLLQPLKDSTLKLMSILAAIGFIVIGFNGIFLFFWNKWCKFFAWISELDEQQYYEPQDTDEGKLFNPYELYDEDIATFQWDENFFGNN